MKNPIVGVGIGDYLSRREGALDKNMFNRKLAAFVRQHNNSLALSPEVLDTLFEICDEYRQTVNGISSFRRDRVRSDQANALNLCRKVVRHLTELNCALQRDASDLRHPQTSHVAKLAASQIAAVHRRLERIAGRIELQSRPTDDMLRLAPLKSSTYEFVSALDDYIDQAYPEKTLLQKDKDIVLAGAMVAAGKFSAGEVRGDVLSRIPMKRSNARKYITQKYVDRFVPMVSRTLRASKIDESQTTIPPSENGHKTRRRLSAR